MIHSDEYEPLMHTLNFLGFSKLYHWSAVFVMPIFSVIHQVGGHG